MGRVVWDGYKTVVCEASSLRNTVILLALAVWLLYPATTRADEIKTAPLVFEVVDGPQYIPPTPKLEEPKPPVKPTVKRVKGNYCSCVLYVKAKIGYTKSVGAARNFPVNSHTPSVGAVIVTYESRVGHVGIVSHWDDKYVYLESEANYSRCKITYGRKIPLNSKLIKGYYG